MAKALQHFRGLKAQALAREIRPTTWSGVAFRPVPLQEGEEGEDEDRASLTDEIPPYPDPLGVIEDIDLRATQALYTAGRLTVDNPRGQQQHHHRRRRNSSSSRGGKEGGSSKKRTRGGSSAAARSIRRAGAGGGGGDHNDDNADVHSIDEDDHDDREEDEEDEDDDDDLEDHEDEETAEWEEVEEVDPLTGRTAHTLNTFYQRTFSIHFINAPSRHNPSSHPVNPHFLPQE